MPNVVEANDHDDPFRDTLTRTKFVIFQKVDLRQKYFFTRNELTALVFKVLRGSVLFSFCLLANLGGRSHHTSPHPDCA